MQWSGLRRPDPPSQTSGVEQATLLALHALAEDGPDPNVHGVGIAEPDAKGASRGNAQFPLARGKRETGATRRAPSGDGDVLGLTLVPSPESGFWDRHCLDLE